MPGLVASGHTSGVTSSWVRGELERVMIKFDPSYVNVLVDTGVAVDIAEVAAMLDIPVALWPLCPWDQWLRFVRSYPGQVQRWSTLASDCKDVDIVMPAGDSVSRAVRTHRSQTAVDLAVPQLVVYDGRTVGQVFAHLNRAMGLVDVIIIDPVQQRTFRLPKEQ